MTTDIPTATEQATRRAVDLVLEIFVATLTAFLERRNEASWRQEFIDLIESAKSQALAELLKHRPPCMLESGRGAALAKKMQEETARSGAPSMFRPK